MKKLLLLGIILFMLFGVHQVRDNPSREIHWTTDDSKAYARDAVQAWADKQYVCLDKLWTKESNWRPNAFNKDKVMGKNAGGIPQLLGMDTKLKPTFQIDRGIHYIIQRYETPCQAWKFHQKKGWY
jgi:hypothetical protein